MHQEINLVNLKNDVISFIKSKQVSTSGYNFSGQRNSTIYSSIFALFILDLFDEVNNLSIRDKNSWIEVIRDQQDVETGLFFPPGLNEHKNLKQILQLTAFCLSALRILDSECKYPLGYMENWDSIYKLDKYFDIYGCFRGVPTSGNMAMFLGIFLTYLYEQSHQPKYIELLEYWFDQHYLYQNKLSGFWNKNTSLNPYHNFQNGFHQMSIFKYWGKPVTNSNKIIDYILKIQDNNGNFSPYPGGSGCYNYDAADILIFLSKQTSYRKFEIIIALKKLLQIIIESQNEDGGFCETQELPTNFFSSFNKNHFSFILKPFNPLLSFIKLKTIYSILRDHNCYLNHFSVIPVSYNSSDLWNTWFKCLTIGEIRDYLSANDNILLSTSFKFHKFIGLGFHKSFT